MSDLIASKITQSIIRLSSELAHGAEGRSPRKDQWPVLELPEPYYSALRREREVVEHIRAQFDDGPLKIAGIVVTLPKPR